MTAQHLAFLVEEPSMEAFLRALLPRILPADHSFEIHPFQDKTDLFARLQSRLSGYAHWLPADWRIVVLVDRDDEDCLLLKAALERMAAAAGLHTRSCTGTRKWQLVNRIVVEELEAWYFGDWTAVCHTYPRVSQAIPTWKGFRDPDAIKGGTWEAFERILRKYGYFKTGLRKVEAARALGSQIDPGRSRSPSFVKFCEALTESTT